MTLCQLAVRHINHFGDWASLGVIAVIRCLALMKPEFTTRVICTKRTITLIIVCIWIYAVLLPMPAYLGVLMLLLILCPYLFRYQSFFNYLIPVSLFPEFHLHKLLFYI